MQTMKSNSFVPLVATLIVLIMGFNFIVSIWLLQVVNMFIVREPSDHKVFIVPSQNLAKFCLAV